MICARCDTQLAPNEFLYCDSCAEYLDAEADQYAKDYEEAPKCGCPFCPCSERTIAGETCSSCNAGAHQG